MELNRRAVTLSLKSLELAAACSMYFLLRFGGREQDLLTFPQADLSMMSVSLVGLAVTSSLLGLLCHLCWGQLQPSHLEICLLFTKFTSFTALGTLIILFDKGTFDDEIERGVRFGKEVMEEVFDLNVNFNEDGAMLALGVLAVLSSFLFLTDMSFALINTKQKTPAITNLPTYPNTAK